MAERAELVLGGLVWAGWTSVRVRRSLETAAGDFSVELSEKHPERPATRTLRHGDPVEVRLGGETVLKGFVDDLEDDYGPHSHVVRLSGRDAAGDLVDCAPDIPPGEWKRIGLDRFARILAEPFGLEVVVDAALGEAFDTLTLDPGQRAWEALEEAARYRAVLVTSDGLGRVVLTEAGRGGRVEGLVQGENVQAARATYSHRERFSEYRVKGQHRGSDTFFGEPAATPEGVARDEGVRRARPLTLVSETATDTARAEERARFEASVRAGRAQSVQATVRSWRQSTGELWRPNARARFDSDWLGIHAELLVVEVEHRDGEGGQRTNLRLMPPVAFARLARPEVEESGLGFLGGA